MEKINTIAAFNSLQERLLSERPKDIATIVISAGTCGQASGANDLIRATKREILQRSLIGRVELRVTGCHGYCETEPSVLVEPHGTFYPRVTPEDMVRIVTAVASGNVLKDLLFVEPRSGKAIEKQSDLPFYKKQVRNILGRNEKVDPIRIYNYIENGGYAPFAKVLSYSDPSWAIAEVKASGLRGRGGAGFPTGLKWELLAAQDGSKGKYLVCNADEGDPGAYMDRAVLEGNPHCIIEGMLIGAFATGATKGVLYVRNEYPLAIKHLTIAISQAREMGLLGGNILGTDFSFDLEIVRGAGAFVCGEETALIRSIEGKMGEPRQRPPFPVQRGINGLPTAINNVETWANIPLLFEVGASEFAKTGTPNNSGTKIFSLVGKIRNTGLVEVPMGISIREIVYDIGGGPIGIGKIKAVQTGGPSGGCIPADQFDLKIDYDTLSKAGSIMGSGGMIVMDETTCIVDVAKYYMSFLKDESCGKCFTCRKGTQRMWELLDDISRGKGTLMHLDLLQELALVVKDTTMCGLGQSAPNPVLSTLRYFRNEYERHILAKRCDAFVCPDLVGAPCQSACPLGTEAWRYIAHIAKGEYEDAYRAIREYNPFPSVCARVCSHPCEYKCRSGQTGLAPISIRALKRFVTDRIDPSIVKPQYSPDKREEKVAVIGAGPAGLSAAHYLSRNGYKVTVFEADDRPGGMLMTGIPAYRLPRETIGKEIQSLVDDNVELKCGTVLGKDTSLDRLFNEGYKAVFLAMGAHKSRLLNIEGEDLAGVHPALRFLKAFNLRGEMLAKGHVGVIGGGDSAVDAARVALRQPGVESVTIFYRRAKHEMPALPEEVEEALHEGIVLEAMVSPVRILSENGKLVGAEFIRNAEGEVDASGRRKPEPVKGSEFVAKLDTLIVTIGDTPDIEFIESMGIAVTKGGALHIDPDTLETSRPGVFAGGDVVTGPNTVVEAIAAGKKAAVMISRYLRGEKLMQPASPRLPEHYIEPLVLDDVALAASGRAKPPSIPLEKRRSGFEEVELVLDVKDAMMEARRCLRCDLDFTQKLAEAAVREVKEA